MSSSDSDVELPVWPEQVVGGKYVRLLEKQLNQLRTEDEHGNRQLFLDDVFVAYLLAFFNPTVRSLRTIEDFSQTVQAQKHLSLRKICKSTLSDFNQLADPSRLEPILTALRKQLLRKQTTQQGSSDELAKLLQKTIAVDGTFLPAAAEVAWAVCNKNNHGVEKHRARIDVQMSVSDWLPETIVVPAPEQSEADCAIEQLQADRLYLYDRGYMSFALLSAHYDASSNEAQSHFVARYRPSGGNSPALQDQDPRELTEEDHAAGVQSDHQGYFVSSNKTRHPLPRFPLREVLVECEGKRQTRHFTINHQPAGRAGSRDCRSVSSSLASGTVFSLAQVLRQLRSFDQPQSRRGADALLCDGDRHLADVLAHGLPTEQVLVCSLGASGSRCRDARRNHAHLTRTRTSMRTRSTNSQTKA